MEHRDGLVSARAGGPPGGRALRAVRRQAGGERRLRLHGEGVEPGARRVPAHVAGPHEPRLLAAVRRHARGQRLAGHEHPRVGRQHGHAAPHSHGPPVAHLRHGAAQPHPRLGQRRLDRQGLGHRYRTLLADTLRYKFCNIFIVFSLFLDLVLKN